MPQADRFLDAAALSLAAYADLLSGDTDRPENRGPLTDAGLPAPLRTDLATRYPDVVAQTRESPTGFSATVFKDTIGTTAGNLTLAIRGTELVPNDLGTGLDIWLAGAGCRKAW